MLRAGISYRQAPRIWCEASTSAGRSCIKLWNPQKRAFAVRPTISIPSLEEWSVYPSSPRASLGSMRTKIPLCAALLPCVARRVKPVERLIFSVKKRAIVRAESPEAMTGVVATRAKPVSLRSLSCLGRGMMLIPSLYEGVRTDTLKVALADRAVAPPIQRASAQAIRVNNFFIESIRVDVMGLR